MRESLTADLADILSRPIDPDTRRRATLHVLDWLGCALLGSRSDAGQAMADWARVQVRGPCLTIGAGRRDPATAAFVNGGLGNVFEMDDLHRTAIVHPGDVVIPAALAAAERMDAPGTGLLDAIIRGYEAAIRIGLAAGPGHYRHWYKTATCGGFGAAAAVASLHGLDRDGIVDALGHAGGYTGGLWQCRAEPSDGKQYNTARAAQSGLLAADVARCGLTGPAEILEGAHGLFVATCPDPDIEAMRAAPTEPWKIHETSFKPWPACRHAHPVIEAALALAVDTPAEDVVAVAIETYGEAIEFCDAPEPITPHQARFSLQHCVATAWLRGEPQLADFEMDALADSEIEALRRRVAIAENVSLSADFPENYGAIMRVERRDGSENAITVETAKGDPENPMTAAEIEDKARTLMAESGLGEDAAERLVVAVFALPVTAANAIGNTVATPASAAAE